MGKTVLLYSIPLAVFIFLLKILEYSFFVHDVSAEVFAGTIALFFSALGIWAGRKFVKQENTETQLAPQPALATETNGIKTDVLKESGISPREYEVLQEMAKGLSNQEIANKLFVSLSTVKTHSANIFIKLDVKRRIQAVQRAKEIGIIS